VNVMAQHHLPMPSSKDAATLARKSEKHTPAYPGLLARAKMSSSVSANITERGWTSREKRDVELKEDFV